MKQVYKPEIRKWLDDNTLTENQELDVHGIPVSLFDLTDTDDRLKQLNRQIKGLPIQQQKLLLYLSRDIDPALIIESMEYSSPELFWLDKALLIKEFDPTARQQDVLQVFAVNESLLAEIYSVSDIMDLEAEKSKSHKYRNWSLIAAPVILLLVYLFIYPVLIKPDPVALYEKFKVTYRPDIASIDTTSYVGGSYYEALLLMDEGNFAESAKLFEEMIPGDSPFRVSSRWFLALINLRNGDRASCREQLKAIQNDDPAFYKQVAEKLSRKL
ncbi:MAG: hypothetical protein WC865_14480 [Bacteroidales bacterium]